MKRLLIILCLFSATLSAGDTPKDKCLGDICIGGDVHAKLSGFGEACAKVISFTSEGKVVIRHENFAVFKAHFAELDPKELSPAVKNIGEIKSGIGVHYKKGCFNKTSTVKRVFANGRVLLGKSVFNSSDTSVKRRIWRDVSEISHAVSCMNGICNTDRVVELGARVCKEGVVSQIFANGLVHVACDGPSTKWRHATELTKVPK